MPVKRNRGTKIVENGDQVRLKPVFGIRPGVYLACIYALALLVLLFFILLYPGLSNPGSLVSFRSEPSGAAVRVDGVYRGTTPCEVFISRGTGAVEMTLPAFQPFKTGAEIPGRLFFSLFAPRRLTIGGELSPADPLEPLRLGAAERAEWSFAGEPSAAYQIPLSLSEGAYRSGPFLTNETLRDRAEKLLASSLRFTNTRAALRDYLRAELLTENQGISPSPLTLLRSGREMLAFLQNNPGAAPALAELLPAERALALQGSSWYAGAAEKAAKAFAGADPDPSPSFEGRLELGGLSFVQAGGRFWIAQTEISPEAWENFLDHNGDWKRENLAALMEKGLVSSGYLETQPVQGLSTGAGGLSWYAAEAFCRWLTAGLPPGLADWEVRLPREDEWEYGALLARNTGDGGGPKDMLGGLWEWCAEPYAPFNFLPADEESINAVSSPERPVRGGAWINPSGSVTEETRASLPPETCSPFLSARPVIARRKGI
jgi:hypothetical protein